MENVKLLLSQKTLKKIKIKIASEHQFFNLQRTGNKNFFMRPNCTRSHAITAANQVICSANDPISPSVVAI